MTLVATYPTKLGELLKGEFKPEHGYMRSIATITVNANDEIGTVYASDGTVLIAADVAGLVGDGTDGLQILIDDRVYDGTTGSRDLAVIAGGPGGSGGAIVVREQLKFGDALSAGQIDTVVAAIEAQGIKVGTQV